MPSCFLEFHYLTQQIQFPVLATVSLEEVMALKKEYNQVLHSYWYQHNFLLPKWWFLVILSIIPPIIWWIFADKKILVEITSFGLFYGVAAIILDSIGSYAIVWIYPFRLTPYLNPQLYPYDVGIVIIPFMLLYQRWHSSFKKFFLLTGLLSLFLSFVAEPFMVMIGIYQEVTWKHIYSFPIYWLLAIICWWIIYKFKAYEKA